jgi:hypothetical protein
MPQRRYRQLPGIVIRIESLLGAILVDPPTKIALGIKEANADDGNS